MGTLAAVFVVFALSSADICSNPVADEYGEPLFCLVSRDMRLATPFFTIDLDEGLYVGVGSKGQRVFIQDAQWGEHFTMEIHAVLGAPEGTEQRTECVDFSLNGAEGLRCDCSPEGDILREYILNRGMKSSNDGDISVSIDFLLGVGGEAFLQQFERILGTLELMQSEQVSG